MCGGLTVPSIVVSRALLSSRMNGGEGSSGEPWDRPALLLIVVCWNKENIFDCSICDAKIWTCVAKIGRAAVQRNSMSAFLFMQIWIVHAILKFAVLGGFLICKRLKVELEHFFSALYINRKLFVARQTQTVPLLVLLGPLSCLNCLNFLPLLKHKYSLHSKGKTRHTKRFSQTRNKPRTDRRRFHSSALVSITISID